MSEPDAPTSDDGVGAARTFAGRYRLVGRRGTGLDIALFEAIDLLGDRPVAVKIIHPDISEQPGFDERFADTMHTVARARHPNVQEVLDIGTASWNGRTVQYIVCENLTGGSLRDLQSRGRQLSPSQAVMVGLDVCRALDIAHRVGLTHGDIRPANLVFGDDGRLRVSDLGLAGLVSEGLWENPAGVSIERARYASPEQAQAREVGSKSDVYSLCLCLLEAVTGQLPFVGDSTVATLANRVDRLLPVSADLGPLAAVFERAARPDPSDRSSAVEFGRAMVQAAERLPRPAPIALLGAGLFAEAHPITDPATPSPVSTPLSLLPTSLPPTSLPPTSLPPTPPADMPVVVPVVAPLASVIDLAPGHALELLRPPPPVTESTSQSTSQSTPPPPPPPPDQSLPLLRERRSRRKLLAVVFVVLLATAMGGVLAWLLRGDTVHTVPDLAGVPQSEALNRISEFGWDVITVEEASDVVADGSVILTDPVAGTSLAEGAAFTMVVSTGPAPRMLPDITGQTVDEATVVLDELDLVLEIGEQINDETVAPGLILAWTVPSQPGLAQGDTVLPGTLVSVTVSSGPAPRVVPDLTSLSLVDATARLQTDTLLVAQLPDEFSPTVPVGGVARQDPPAGTAVERGTTVSVALSKGPDIVAVPPLAGLTPAQSAQALEAVGLVIGQVKGDPTGVNVLAEVEGASIGAGASFPRGTEIDLTFQVPPPPTTTPPTTPPTTVPPTVPPTTVAPA